MIGSLMEDPQISKDFTAQDKSLGPRDRYAKVSPRDVWEAVTFADKEADTEHVQDEESDADPEATKYAESIAKRRKEERRLRKSGWVKVEMPSDTDTKLSRDPRSTRG